MSLINTSVDDIKSTLKCCEKQYTLESLYVEREKEVRGQNRKSVIMLLDAAIKRKIKNKK